MSGETGFSAHPPGLKECTLFEGANFTCQRAGHRVNCRGKDNHLRQYAQFHVMAIVYVIPVPPLQFSQLTMNPAYSILSISVFVPR